ncbi:hypothetical protein HY546_01510 [archaeon]|nr:hypothetical protein [archaeon]
MAINELAKSRRIRLFLIALLVIGILPFFLKPLQFGRDFVGGTSIAMQLERPLEQSELSTTVESLQRRLNAFGLKDISVRPLGNQFVSVDLAETDPKVVNQLHDLLTQQGKFEALFEKKPVLTGTGIVDVYTSPQQGFAVYPSEGGYLWTVPFIVTSESARQFSEAVSGRCTPITRDRCAEQVYMFIDRPENAVVLLNSSFADLEQNVPADLSVSAQTVLMTELLENSNVGLVVSNELDNSTLKKISNKTVVIVAGSFEVVTLNMSAAKVIEKPAKRVWIASAIGLENIVHLTPSVTSGTPFTNPTITGGALTKEDAFREANRIAILLKSGRLPVSLSVSDVSTTSAVLGRSFLKSAFFAGAGAGLTVAAIIFLRYRRLRIALPIILTAFSEVVMIVGLAAWIGWQIDFAAIAGIVAAVGTGVDHQVVIVDEVLRRERELELTLTGKIKKAFSIIFMSAATVIFAMLPLLFMGLGALKGFAITTILGSLIGVFIARPAFAEIINILIKGEGMPREK